MLRTSLRSALRALPALLLAAAAAFPAGGAAGEPGGGGGGTVQPLAQACAGRFCDEDGSVHEANIERIAQWQITLGCSATDANLFCPAADITRRQMAAFLYRAVSQRWTIPTPATAELSDVAADAWFRTFADWVVSVNAFSAPGGVFNPGGVVTRADMAVMMIAAFPHLEAVAEPEGLFQDAQGADPAVIRAIEGMYQTGVTRGCSTSSLNYCPDLPVTRAQMASFFVRAIDQTPTTPPQTAATPPTDTTTTTVAVLPPDPDGIYRGDPLQLIAHAEFARAYTLPGSAGDRFDVWLCNTPSVRHYSENPDFRHNPSNYADKFHSQVSPWFRWLSGGLYAPMFRPGGVVTVGLSPDYYQSCYREVFDRYPGGGSDTDGVVIVVGFSDRYDVLGLGGCGLFSQRTFPDNGRAVLVNGSAFTDPTILAHEMGHALCWPHSFSGETENGGEVWEYDNPMDIMGWSSSVQSAPMPGLGTLALNRYAAGWVPPSRVAVHTPGAAARYTLEPIGGAGLQLLIVPYKADDRSYYLALGVRVRGEGDLWWADKDIVKEGVEIYDIDQTPRGCDLPDRGYCYGLDRRTRPLFDSDEEYKAWDAAHVMQPDEGWYWHDYEIEVISRDGDSFVVEVRPYTE